MFFGGWREICRRATSCRRARCRRALIADHVLLRLVHCKLPRRLVVFDQEEVGTDLAVVLFKVSVEGKEHLVLVGQGAFLLALLLKYRLEYVANRMRCDAISCEME